MKCEMKIDTHVENQYTWQYGQNEIDASSIKGTKRRIHRFQVKIISVT